MLLTRHFNERRLEAGESFNTQEKNKQPKNFLPQIIKQHLLVGRPAQLLTSGFIFRAKRPACPRSTAQTTRRRLSMACGRRVPTSTPTGWSYCCWSSSCWSPTSCCLTCSLPCSGRCRCVCWPSETMFCTILSPFWQFLIFGLFSQNSNGAAFHD